MIVAYTTPASPVQDINKLVANDEANMLTRLLPKRIEPINLSRRFNNCKTIVSFLLQLASKWVSLGLEAAVNAVSEPLKKAEKIIKIRTTIRVRIM